MPCQPWANWKPARQPPLQHSSDSSQAVLGIAPGRVELLGNHTDYNGGLVMAVAIDRFTVVAGRPTSGRRCQAHAVNSQGNVAFELDKLERGESGDWPNYVKGVVWAIQEAGAGP